MSTCAEVASLLTSGLHMRYVNSRFRAELVKEFTQIHHKRDFLR